MYKYFVWRNIIYPEISGQTTCPINTEVFVEARIEFVTSFKQKIYHRKYSDSTISFSLIQYSFESVKPKQSYEIYWFLQRKYVSGNTVKDLPNPIILLLVNFTRLNPLFAAEVNKKVSYNNHRDIGHFLLTHPLSHYAGTPLPEFW